MESPEIREAFTAMVEIHRIASTTLAPGATEEQRRRAKERIEALVAHEATLRPELYPELVRFAEYTSFEPDASTEAWFVASALAGLGIVISGPAGIALGVASIFAGPALEAWLEFAVQGGDPIAMTLPNMDRSQLEAYALLAQERMVDLYQKDPSFSRYGIKIDVADSIGFKRSDDSGLIIEKLPPEMQEPAREALAKPGDRKMTDAELEAAFEKGAKASLERLAELIERQRAIQEEQLSEYQRRVKLAENRRKFERLNAEISGAAQIGIAAFTLFGNRDAANAINVGTQAVQKVYTTVWQYTNNLIGEFALTGGVLSGVSLLSHLGGESSEAQLLRAIGQIQEQLVSIENRLIRVEATQHRILRILGVTLKEMRENHLAAMARLDLLQKEMYAASNEVNEIARSDDEVEFADECEAIRALVDGARADAEVLAEDYNYLMRRFYIFAVRVSKKPAFVGGVASDVSVAQARSEVKKTRKVEHLFGFLEGYGDIVGLPPVEHRAEGGLVCNPVVWAKGARAFLEARVLLPDASPASEVRWLRRLYYEGLAVRAVARRVSDYTSLRKASEVFVEKSGADQGDKAEPTTMVGLVTQALKESESFHSTPKYKPSKKKDKKENIPAGEIQYFVRGGYFTVKNDPIDLATSDEIGVLIKKKVRTVYNHDRAKQIEYRLIYAKGPKKGKALKDGTKECRIFENQQKRANYGLIRQYMTGKLTRGGSPHDLWDLVYDVIRELHDRPQIMENAAGSVKTKIDSSKTLVPVVDFEGYGGILRIFTSIAQWRMAPVELTRLVTDLRNVDGMLTSDHVVAHIRGLTVDAAEKGAFLTYKEIANSLAGAIKEDARRLLSAADNLPEERGLEVVDSTLRALASYMAAREIPLTAPRA